MKATKYLNKQNLGSEDYASVFLLAQYGLYYVSTNLCFAIIGKNFNQCCSPTSTANNSKFH